MVQINNKSSSQFKPGGEIAELRTRFLGVILKSVAGVRPHISYRGFVFVGRVCEKGRPSHQSKVPVAILEPVVQGNRSDRIRDQQYTACNINKQISLTYRSGEFY